MGLVEWKCLGCKFFARDYSGYAECPKCGKWGYDVK